MYREIQCCFDMSITVKQMSHESVIERSQRLQIPDVWWQLVPCCWSGHSKGSSPKVCWCWDDDEVIPLTEDTGWQKSVRYCGTRPCRALYTSRQICDQICCQYHQSDHSPFTNFVHLLVAAWLSGHMLALINGQYWDGCSSCWYLTKSIHSA